MSIACTSYACFLYFTCINILPQGGSRRMQSQIEPLHSMWQGLISTTGPSPSREYTHGSLFFFLPAPIVPDLSVQDARRPSHVHLTCPSSEEKSVWAHDSLRVPRSGASFYPLLSLSLSLSLHSFFLSLPSSLLTSRTLSRSFSLSLHPFLPACGPLFAHLPSLGTRDSLSARTS